MKKIDYLPIGTVVMLKGGTKRCMVISRGVGTTIDNELQVFDYGACLYPEGLVGTNIIYFNHEDIVEIVHKGLDSEENKILTNNINDIFEKSGLKKGNPYELNLQNIKKYAK